MVTDPSGGGERAKMDNDTLTSRVERTWWTVWNYITGAVSRLLRPESTNIIRSDLNSSQEAAVDSGPAKCHTEDDARATDVDEEQPLSTVSVISSSRTVVAWKLCTDISGGPGEESVPCKTEQVNRGSESKASTDSESTRDADFLQPGNDDAGLLFNEDAKGGKQEENKVRKLFTDEPAEMQENNEYEEHVKTMSLLAGYAISEDVVESRRKPGGVEETETAMKDDLPKIDESMTKIKTTEEDKKMHHGDKQNLKAEDTEVKLCMTMALRGEEEDNMHMEEVKVQRDGADVDGAVMNAGVEGSDVILQLEGATQGENQLSVCDELPDADRDFKGDTDLTSLRVGLHMADRKNVTVSIGNEMSRRSESDKAEDEGEQGAVKEEESVTVAGDNQTINRLPEKEDNKKSVPEGSQEEEVSAGRVPRSESLVQNSKSELDSAEFTDGKHEDMINCTAVQTNTKRTDNVPTESRSEAIALRSDLTTAVSIDERCLVEDQAEEERLSGKSGDEDCCTERANTVGSLPVKPEGNAEREIREHFKNIALGICEGRLVGSPERHSPTCEETQEGVPEYNNEPRPDENTARRFLEVLDGGGIQNTRLPEEAEGREPESLQSSGSNTGADCLVGRKHKEEGEEDNPNRFDLVVENRSAKLCPADAGLPQEMNTPLTEAGEEEGKLLVNSLKIGIRHSEKELERHVGLLDEMAKQLRNETEELLVEFGMDEGLCEVNERGAAAEGCEMSGAMAAEEVVKCADETLKLIDAEAQEMTETSNSMESVDYMKSEQNNRRALSLREDFTESGFLKQSVGTNHAEMQNARIDKEKTGHEVEEEAAEDHVQRKNDMEFLNLQAVGRADGLITERKEKENTLNAKSDSRETLNQLSDETLAISNEETEGAGETMTGESKPKDATVRSAEMIHVTEAEESFAEETGAPNNERQDVIDKEILDLWIHAALSEDTVGMKRQDWLESGRQMQTEMEASYEEQDEPSSVLTEKDDEQLVESNPVESESVNVTEMSSSTAEAGFSDQSLGDCGAQSGETQLLDSASSGSFQDVGNMSESAASISELLTQQPNSRDTLVEDNIEAPQSCMIEGESSEAGHLNRDLDKSQGKRDTGAALEREIDDEVTDFPGKAEWEGDERADAEMDVLFEAEETKVADKLREMTVSGAPDEIELTDSDRSGTGSDSVIEEGIVPTGSGSQKNACGESGNNPFELPSLDRPHPLWSEGVADALSGPKTADDAEQLTTEFAVDISVLDLTAQRSRIAVRNPRVRPAKNPRALVHMPSVNPTPPSHLPPLGGFGIGIKLPGLGSGFPTLKKTQQEPESKPEEKSDIPKQDEAKVKLKPMPPRHPGFASPLMSELKSKLKKTPKYDES